jgi:2,5-dihydroxypyridine 5,6-dioxygenase
MTNPNRLRELPGLIESALSLSEVKEGERIALISTHSYVPEILDAYRTALGNLGADFVRVELPPRVRGEGPGLNNPLGPFAFDLLKSADMVVRPLTVWPPKASDVTMYSDEFRETLFSGTRWLDFMIDEMSMRRLFPTPQMLARGDAGAERMAKAETIRIKSEAGTDLTLSKKGRKGSRNMGAVREPGAWGNFGFGAVSTAPVEDSANGTVVFDRGDSLGFLLGTLNDFCTDPVRLTFEDGEIVEIEGDVTAQVFKQHSQEIDRPEFYRIAHIGWGINEQAVWGGSHFTVADWESFYGSLILHFGHNTFDTPAHNVGQGGNNVPSRPWPLPHHTGGTLLKHDFYLDDEPIILAGKIVAQDLK